MSDGTAGPEGVNGGRACGSAQHPCRCLFQGPSPVQTRAVAPGSAWPGIFPAWLLDLKQILNHPQVSIIIGTQDEDFLSYLIDVKVSEGG